VWIIPAFPRIAPGQVVTAKWLMLILSLRIAVGFPMTVFGAVTTARQRFALNGSIAIVFALLNGAATYLVLSTGHGLLTLVATTTALNLLSYVAYALSARHVFPAMRISLSRFRPHRVREVTAFSLYVFIIDIAIQIGFNLDNVVVGAFLGTSAVAVYAVSLRLADYQRQLSNQFNQLLFPVVVSFKTRGEADALRNTLITGTRVALALVTGVTVCLIGLAGPLIDLWMGAGFHESVTPLYVLAVAGVVLVGQGPLGNVLLGTGRHRLVAYCSMGEALANLAMSVWLVRVYGLVGVALGTAIPVVIANLAILMPAACRDLGLRVTTFLGRTAIPPLLAALPTALTITVLRSVLPAASLQVVFAEGLVAAVVYLISLAMLGISTEERTRSVAYLRQVSRRHLHAPPFQVADTAAVRTRR
jgi:O-antigen/teichoic acid export membrane protein